MTGQPLPASRPDHEPWGHPSPVLDALGSLLAHRTDPLRAGFEVTTTKLNGRGLLHAGVIATIADVTIGHALASLAGEGQRYVTIDLSCQLLGRAGPGDWVEVAVEPTKTRGRLAAGHARFSRDGRTIATARALFLPA